MAPHHPSSYQPEKLWMHAPKPKAKFNDEWKNCQVNDHRRIMFIYFYLGIQRLTWLALLDISVGLVASEAALSEIAAAASSWTV